MAKKQKAPRIELVDHPVEVARKALAEAATFEWESGNRSWAGRFASLAENLPKREQIERAVAA